VPRATMGNCHHHPEDAGSCTGQEYQEIVADVVDMEKAKARSSNATLTHARCYHQKADRKLAEDYAVDGEVLGTGLCGKVLLARSRSDGRRFALKTIRKEQVSRTKLRALAAEVEICLTLDHPNIARLQHVYETEREIHLLLECCEGGEMYDRLHKRGVYRDADAAEATRQMLRAIGHLHSKNIVHRDIKLENFLYESDAEDAELKLIDFGFAKIWDPSTLMLATCGSIAYVSPDVISGKGYCSKCDLWSIGVVLWMILTGYPPFHGPEKKVMDNIKAGTPDWSHAERWSRVSPEAIDLIKALLQKDPKRRPSAQEALQHPWLTLNKGSKECRDVKLSRGSLRSLASYSNASRLRRAVLLLLAQELEPEETCELRQLFNSMDKSGEGTISFRELKEAIRNSYALSPAKPTKTQDLSFGFDSPQRPQQRPREDAPSPVTPAAMSPGSPVTPARALCRADSRTLSELFSILDANGDERIYYSDFLASTMEARLRSREEAVRATFRRLDADCSGTIGVKDLRAVLGANFTEAEVEEFTVKLNSSSGEISYEAFLEALRDGIGACHRQGAGRGLGAFPLASISHGGG